MEKYIHYKVLDFVEDDSFVRWVHNKAEQEDINWDVWLKENPSKSDEVSQAKVLVSQLKFKEESIPSGTEEKLLANITNAIKETPQAEVKSFTKYRRLFIGAAAAAVLLFVFVNVFSTSYDTIQNTSYAEMKSIDLPDGSKVTVNALSEIKFDKKSWNENRIVVLDGEAFFEVEKGSKFTVETHNGNVEVLGTSFNVYSRGEDFNVLCESGKVSVTSNKMIKILLPNQGVNIKNGDSKFITSVELNDRRTGWIDGIYQYKNESLINVIQEIERQLNYKIEIPSNLRDDKYSGSFDINNKEETLSEVLWPLGLKYNIDGRNVVVSEE